MLYFSMFSTVFLCCLRLISECCSDRLYVFLWSERVPDGESAGPSLQRLQAEVAELRAVKARRDAQFDQLSAVVEQRTDQFKRLMAARNTEIESLQAQLRRASSQVLPPSADPGY